MSVTKRDKILWLTLLAAALAVLALTAGEPDNVDLAYPRPTSSRTAEVKLGDYQPQPDFYTNAPKLIRGPAVRPPGRFSDMLPPAALTNSVTLTWDASPSSGVIGYKIHRADRPGHYVKVYDAGNVLAATISGISGSNYFAATAYDSTGLESDLSNEILFVASPTLDFSVTLEAESGAITAPITTGLDGSVKFVYSPTDNLGSVALPFVTPFDSTFYVWARTRAFGPDSDSMTVSLDGGVSAAVLPFSTNYGSWQWTKAGTASLVAGSNSVILTCREAMAQVDYVLVTTKTNSPSTVTNYQDVLWVQSTYFGGSFTNWIRVPLTNFGQYRIIGTKEIVP